jgi:hypothetical protein
MTALTRRTRFIIILNPYVSLCEGVMPKFRLIEIRFGLAKATVRVNANPLC